MKTSTIFDNIYFNIFKGVLYLSMNPQWELCSQTDEFLGVFQSFAFFLDCCVALTLARTSQKWDHSFLSCSSISLALSDSSWEISSDGWDILQWDWTSHLGDANDHEDLCHLVVNQKLDAYPTSHSTVERCQMGSYGLFVKYKTFLLPIDYPSKSPLSPWGRSKGKN